VGRRGEGIMASRASMVHAALELGPSLYDPFFDYMERNIKAARNKVFFSRLIESMNAGVYKMYDIDSIVFQRRFNKFGQLVDEIPILALEMKFQSWRVAKEAILNGEVEVNGFQFMRLRRLAKLIEIPFYYFINIEGRKFILFNILSVKPRFEKKYEGTRRDLYAVLSLDDLIVARDIETLKTDLRLILEGKEVV